jgi:outer membrane immunogenic protein
MKKLLITSIAALGLIGTSAFAADMAVKIPVKAPPPPAPVYTWTGCYVGGNLGGGWTSTGWANPEGSSPGDRGDAHFSGFVGGGQVGCDYQFASAWVIGIQGMFDGANMKGGVLDTFNTDFDLTTRINWFATLTGRLGYAIQPNLLLYGGGGAAWVRDHDVELLLGSPSAAGNVTRNGWVALGGLEWMFAPNWSAFFQYQYMDFGKHTDPLFFVDGSGPHTFDINQHVQAVLVGLNYRFWGGPWGGKSPAPVVTK